ncbi:hypothetical protein HU200_008589 [Digitaria exilis]|uniref:KIB1-4 beta-propeller domain-containing protein n=1 Tax=Digitaria exilis TaxID=1010633 RepID=A0A835FML3_9POAL|nr:hypothetical protein HU200_008589 [Digitaria exilis]
MASAGKSSPIALELSRPLLMIDNMLQGRRCLACLEGEWLFMLEEDTSQCFLLSLSSLRKIQLPPLLTPVELRSRCAISSPTPPECIVFSTNGDYLVYCRPGDEEWWGLPDETDGTYVLINGTFKLFDPIVEKEYTLKSSRLVPCNDYFQMLLFAKHGWVLVLRGNKYMYAANPFTGDMLELLEIPCLGNQFDGISFSSAPKSPDCIVCAIEKTRNPSSNDRLYVMVWHAGDEHWTRLEIEDYTQFRTAYNNLVFYHDEFYCMGTRGNLGIFKPHNMTWIVLDKPIAILDGDPWPGEKYCHLLEFRDNLIAVFRPHDDGPIDLYRLDMSQMVWNKIESLDNEVVFVDHWNAVMMLAPRDTCCNRIYLPKLGRDVEGQEPTSSVFYDLKSRKYYPSYFNLTERMNSIWVKPNFRCQ